MRCVTVCVRVLINKLLKCFSAFRVVSVFDPSGLHIRTISDQHGVLLIFIMSRGVHDVGPAVKKPHPIVPPAVLTCAGLRFYLGCAYGILFSCECVIKGRPLRFASFVLSSMIVGSDLSRREGLADTTRLMCLGGSRCDHVILDMPGECADIPVNIMKRFGRLRGGAC